MKDTLLLMLTELNERITTENLEREESGALKLSPVEIRILGQVSLLANELVAKVLPLQMTNDLDAVFKAGQSYARDIFKNEILPKHGLILDDDSEKVWIPPGSRFERLCEYPYVRAWLLDAESALVSKAVKAPRKNRMLIADAIANGLFPGLAERIEKAGGDLRNFTET